MSSYYEHEREPSERKRERARVPMPPEDRSLYPLMDKYLSSRQLDYALAVANHWYPTLDEWGTPRVVIPCTNARGLPYWQARALTENVRVRYTSSPCDREDSLCVVWPLCSARAAAIVEGPLDSLAAASAGELGISLMGKEPSPTVLVALERLLRKANTSRIIVIPDNDSPEMGARLVSWLSGSGLRVFVALPPSKDLAAMSPDARKKLLDR